MFSYGLPVEGFAINQDMYYYFNSVDANQSIDQNNSPTPAPVYSNFVGGRGIFGPVMSK